MCIYEHAYPLVYQYIPTGESTAHPRMHTAYSCIFTACPLPSLLSLQAQAAADALEEERALHQEEKVALTAAFEEELHEEMQARESSAENKGLVRKLEEQLEAQVRHPAHVA